MKDLLKAPCSECSGALRRKAVTQQFEREGLAVKLSGIQALVCSRCGEIYFEPGGADQLAQAVNSLFALAHTAKQHKGKVRAQIS